MVMLLGDAQLREATDKPLVLHMPIFGEPGEG